MNIQAVSSKTDLTKRMIRHYEELGLIKPVRGENTYRDYSEDDINRLLCIRSLKEIGLSLESIGKILREENVEKILRQHLCELQSCQ